MRETVYNKLNPWGLADHDAETCAVRQSGRSFAKEGQGS